MIIIVFLIWFICKIFIVMLLFMIKLDIYILDPINNPLNYILTITTKLLIYIFKK